MHVCRDDGRGQGVCEALPGSHQGGLATLLAGTAHVAPHLERAVVCPHQQQRARLPAVEKVQRGDPRASSVAVGAVAHLGGLLPVPHPATPNMAVLQQNLHTKSDQNNTCI